MGAQRPGGRWTVLCRAIGWRENRSAVAYKADAEPGKQKITGYGKSNFIIRVDGTRVGEPDQHEGERWAARGGHEGRKAGCGGEQGYPADHGNHSKDRH